MDNNWAVAEKGRRSLLSGEVKVSVTGELAVSGARLRSSYTWRVKRRELTWLGKGLLWYCRACLRDHQLGNLRDPWNRMEASRRVCTGLDGPWCWCSYHQLIRAGRECGRLAQAVRDDWSQVVDGCDERRQGNLLKGPKVSKSGKP